MKWFENSYGCSPLEELVNTFIETIPDFGFYIKIEIHNENKTFGNLSKEEKKFQDDYVSYVIKELKCRHRARVLLVIRGEVDHFWAGSGFGCFHGYNLWIMQNIDLRSLKETCMELELDCKGNRMADIDVFYKGKKVTRKAENYGL